MTLIAPEVIETLESWEALADAARAVAGDLDSGRFTLGDIANKCARCYGQDSIGKLATEIRVAKRQTLYEYAKVSARFEPSARAEYLDAGLTFSHFRTAIRAGDDAEGWLSEAVENGWPVAELNRQIAAAIGAKVGPTKLWEGEAVIVFYDGVQMTMDCGFPDALMWPKFPNYAKVFVKVYAVDVEGERTTLADNLRAHDEAEQGAE